MFSRLVLLRSLKTRITFFSLAIFVASIWVLSFSSIRMLQSDMQRVLGEQQFSTASFIASQVNDELADRLAALERIAGNMNIDLIRKPAAMQKWLEDRQAIHVMFNGGIYITGIDGTAIASLPVSVGRVGVNYMERDNVAAALKGGKAGISKPTLGKQLNSPVFSIATPIRDSLGKVIGAFVGVVDLGKASFLDQLTENTYGRTGGYLLVAAQHRLIVTATDKKRILEASPEPGRIPLIDRFLAGYEGTGVAVNPQGVEVLISAKQVPVAGWYVSAGLPTTEAFAPIQDMQKHVLWVTTLLTLLAGSLTWWMLRRQLAPMLTAAKTLAQLSESDQPHQALPIASQDEIGELIGGFNHLLASLNKRDEELRKEQQRLSNILWGTGVGTWEWNVQSGEIRINAQWAEMVGYRLEELAPISNDTWVHFSHPDDQARSVGLIARHFSGELDHYEIEARVRHKAGHWVWVLGRGKLVSRTPDGRPEWMAGTHWDITERKNLETEVRQLAYFDSLTGLPNRRMLSDRLSFAMAASQRRSLHGALMFLDLDNFKALNDTHGHGVGDLLLIEVARRLSNCVRKTDTIARLGGDEFVVMLSELDTDNFASTELARVISEKVRITLGNPYQFNVLHAGKPATSVEHHCTASIGVVVFIGQSSSQEDILKWGDAAMYQAKKAGRNAVRFYQG
jgi:diguanylate cyclase (GGDEF)-like protein/PAS domain S-box-containing protein